MELSVLTYNIHSCVGVDGKWLPKRVARLLQAVDADVVGLQEVGWHTRGKREFDQFAYLRRKTGYHLVAGATKEHRDAHFGNALLTREPARAVRPIDLTVERHVPRGALDAEVEIGGVVIRIIVLHLGLAPWERRAQMGRIVAALEGGVDRPTLVMGDFNQWRPQSDAMSRLGNLLPVIVKELTFHTRLPVVPFDRILASRHFSLLDHEVVMSDDARVASDHLPLRATFRLG